MPKIDGKLLRAACIAYDDNSCGEESVDDTGMWAAIEAYEAAKASSDSAAAARKARDKNAPENETSMGCAATIGIAAVTEQPVGSSQDEVERVAKAICREWHSTNVEKQHTDWCVEKFWQKCIPEAKAAIEAMATKRESGELREAMQRIHDCAKGIMPIHTDMHKLMLDIISFEDARWTRLFAIYSEAAKALGIFNDIEGESSKL